MNVVLAFSGCASGDDEAIELVAPNGTTGLAGAKESSENSSVPRMELNYTDLAVVRFEFPDGPTATPPAPSELVVPANTSSLRINGAFYGSNLAIVNSKISPIMGGDVGVLVEWTHNQTRFATILFDSNSYNLSPGGTWELQNFSFDRPNGEEPRTLRFSTTGWGDISVEFRVERGRWIQVDEELEPGDGTN